MFLLYKYLINNLKFNFNFFLLFSNLTKQLTISHNKLTMKNKSLFYFFLKKLQIEKTVKKYKRKNYVRPTFKNILGINFFLNSINKSKPKKIFKNILVFLSKLFYIKFKTFKLTCKSNFFNLLKGSSYIGNQSQCLTKYENFLWPFLKQKKTNKLSIFLRLAEFKNVRKTYLFKNKFFFNSHLKLNQLIQPIFSKFNTLTLLNTNLYNILTIFNKPTFLKFFLYNKKNFIFSFFENKKINFEHKHCLSKIFDLTTNINTKTVFSYEFRRIFVKLTSSNKFNAYSNVWWYFSVVRFFEYLNGSKVFFKFFTFLNNSLTVFEKIRCAIWARKVKNFRKILGPRLFVNEAIQILYISFKLKDHYFLINWMKEMLHKLNFWKFKFFFYFLRYTIKNFFWAIFKEIKMKGIRMKLKGKISVAGNSRTRSIVHSIGITGNSKFNNKIVTSLELIRTFTGVQGLQLWLIF